MYDTLRLIGEYTESKQYAKIRALLTDLEPFDIAGILEELEPESLVLVFRLLPKELAAEAFAEMEIGRAHV